MKLALSLVAVALLATAAPAGASCASPPPLRAALGDARTAFVGTVVALSNADRNATVRVESVWLGPLLPGRVEVHGGPQQANLVSSVQRTYSEGERYLFVFDDATAPFQDDACSATTDYTDEVAALEPEGAADPRSPGGAPFGAWMAVAVVLVGGAVLQARRAWRRAREIEV